MIAMLKKSEFSGLLPCRLGVVKENSDRAYLKLNRYRCGDSYTNVLSAGLNEINTV